MSRSSKRHNAAENVPARARVEPLVQTRPRPPFRWRGVKATVSMYINSDTVVFSPHRCQ